MTKSIKQMNKSELVSYAAANGREDITESMTKKEILLSLEEDGLDEVVEAEQEKKNDVPASSDEKQIVRILKKASYYSYGQYVFTTEREFVLMDKESAEMIIKNNPGDFRTATTKEVEDYYS